MNMERQQPDRPDGRPDTPAEAAMRQGIMVLSPFFVVMSRIVGVLIALIGLFLLVAGVAGAADGTDGALVLAIVGLVLTALGLGIFFGGPRYARTVRRYHGADSQPS